MTRKVLYKYSPFTNTAVEGQGTGTFLLVFLCCILSLLLFWILDLICLFWFVLLLFAKYDVLLKE